MTTIMNVDDYIDEIYKRLEKTRVSASLHGRSTRSIPAAIASLARIVPILAIALPVRLPL